MSRVTKRVMKVALTLVLFQFLAPALLLSPREIRYQDQTSYNLQHSLLVVPFLFKEKDETESEKSMPGSKQILLLDLIAHCSNLKTTSCKYIFLFAHSYNSQPRLFALYRAFLIWFPETILSQSNTAFREGCFEYASFRWSNLRAPNI